MLEPKFEVRDITMEIPERYERPEKFYVSFYVFVDEDGTDEWEPVSEYPIRIPFAGNHAAYWQKDILAKVRERAENVKSEYILKRVRGFNL